MTDLPDSIFIDVSVLEDFCRGYKIAHEKPEKSLNGLNKKGVRLEISEKAFRPIQRRTRNRESIIRHLFLKSKEYIELEKTETQFLADILNKTSLNKALQFDIDEAYREDIDKFREYISKTSLQDFNERTHTLRMQWKNYEEEIRRLIKLFENDRSNWQLKGSLGSHLKTEVQSQSLVDAAFWAQGTPNEYCLIRERGVVYQNQDKINEIIGSILHRVNIEFRTTGQIASHLGKDLSP